MDDRERLQRYLEWRERTDRPAQRAVRRRRVRGVLVGAAVGAVGFGALALVLYATRHSASLARHDPPADNPAHVSDFASSPSLTPPPAPAAPPAPTASAVIDRSPVTPPTSAPAASAPAVRRTGRSTVRTSARAAAVRERVHGEPANEATTPSAAPSAPDDSAPPVVIATPSAPSPAAAAAPTVTAVPPVPVSAHSTVVVENAPPMEQMLPVTTITPGTVTSITSKPDCERMADCAGGWVKGESREFTDGVKRQVDDFRTGVDRVGRGLQWLGSKLRRSE